MKTNFHGGGYAFTNGDLSLDPVLKIEDATFEMHTVALKYIRTFELLGRSARVDLAGAYQDGTWKGTLDGVAARAERKGWADPVMRFAVNLYGAPPLEGQEFASYRAEQERETIVGAGLAVHVPLGEYFDDKLINLGSNRFTIRPQLGVVHNRGKWGFELTGSAWIYTDNDDFFGGKKLEWRRKGRPEAEPPFRPQCRIRRHSQLRSEGRLSREAGPGRYGSRFRQLHRRCDLLLVGVGIEAQRVRRQIFSDTGTVLSPRPNGKAPEVLTKSPHTEWCLRRS